MQPPVVWTDELAGGMILLAFLFGNLSGMVLLGSTIWWQMRKMRKSMDRFWAQSSKPHFDQD